ncbi:TPR-like protein [Sistotremastrum niveocremeum HHB9708]|uniref:TPR-like protein n=1 Tax=Sistotremastrum niveocremeum HHB9708 TaxID=1314777 RepID=A0A164R906_9AGAM|nr:TPR-like protein [Sistotremastrum niveocremeum HHB9708]
MTPHLAHLNGPTSAVQRLAMANEKTWLLIGSSDDGGAGEVSEQMGNMDFALGAYEHALRHNPRCVQALTQVAGIARIKENYPKAIDFFQRVVSLPGHEGNGEVWSALGHCYLMQDDLQKAYSAYQQALYNLQNPKEDPKLWYGIGILYDRYGSLDHAEEAFASVLRMDKDFDKANEILFRLGIIYKQQGKYDKSLECFDSILRSPPLPLAHVDIWFQIGHVHEQRKDFARAKEAYERVVAENPNHAKVLQQLGWLYHQASQFQNQELAIQYLTKSLEAEPTDAQSWYLLGRAYMAGQKYNKAYEAYQQAVYRDGRNPTFWCSIGVLYFQINQYRDALDAYSRAIRINPYISEVWFDLGSLYESCNNQIGDAIDAYGRAAELDPNNMHIRRRLELLKNAQQTGGQLPAAPGPQDVHPTAYASTAGPPNMIGGPQQLMGGSVVTGPPGGPGARPLFSRSDSRGPMDHSLPAPIPPPAVRQSPGPFRGGPPPPVNIDDSRRPSHHTQLAPMEVDRPPAPRESGSFVRAATLRGDLLRITRAQDVAYEGGGGQTSTSHEKVEPGWERREHSRERKRAPYPSSSRQEPQSPARYHYDAARGSPRGSAGEPGRRSASDDRSPERQWGQRQGRTHTGPIGRRSPSPADPTPRRFDPVFFEREQPRPQHSDSDRPVERKIEISVDSYRTGLKSQRHPQPSRRGSESPQPDRRNRAAKDAEHAERRERRKRNGTSRRGAEMEGIEGPSSFPDQQSSRPDTPANRSLPSPTEIISAPAPPPRAVDEDYDEDAAETLIGMASYRGPETTSKPPSAGKPPSNSSSHHRNGSPRLAKRDSDGSVHSPGSHGSTSLKRPHSPVSPEPAEAKRPRVDSTSGSYRAASPRRTASPVPPKSSQLSPVPFRMQASPEIFRSAEMDKNRVPEPAPQVASPPRSPKSRRGSAASNGNGVTLPPITTMSPPPHRRSPSPRDELPPPPREREPERKNLGLVDHTSPRSSTPQSSLSSKRESVAPGGEIAQRNATPPGRGSPRDAA